MKYLVHSRNRRHEEDQVAAKFEVLCSKMQQVSQTLLKVVCISRGNMCLSIRDLVGLGHRLLASCAHPIRRVANDSIKNVLQPPMKLHCCCRYTVMDLLTTSTVMLSLMVAML